MIEYQITNQIAGCTHRRSSTLLRGRTIKLHINRIIWVLIWPTTVTLLILNSKWYDLGIYTQVCQLSACLFFQQIWINDTSFTFSQKCLIFLTLPRWWNMACSVLKLSSVHKERYFTSSTASIRSVKAICPVLASD